MQQTITNIKNWAVARGLHTADPKAQMCKLMEKAGELATAINKDRGEEEITDAIGDCVVVLTILGMQTGVDIEESVLAAYEEIKDRKGMMIGGVFVKDGDESLEYAEAKRRQAMMERADGGLFKPEDGQEYWCVTHGEIVSTNWGDDHEMDHSRYVIGNCFPTEQEAEDAVCVLKLIQKARESQDGFVPDWENLEQNKYSLYFDMGEVCIIECSSQNLTPIFGFWHDESACQKFLHENRDDILWYFTEYRR